MTLNLNTEDGEEKITLFYTHYAYDFFILETSNSSSDSDITNQSSVNEENVSDESVDDIDSEPPVFDDSKEINYKIKYKQTFEEAISINNVYILNLDAQKR